MCIIFQIVLCNANTVFNLYGVSYGQLNLLLNLLCIKCDISVSCFSVSYHSVHPHRLLGYQCACLWSPSPSMACVTNFHLPEPLIELQTWLKKFSTVSIILRIVRKWDLNWSVYHILKECHWCMYCSWELITRHCGWMVLHIQEVLN